jgi:hypothetical protein
MMGTKVRTFSPLPRDLSLEDLVPQDNLYRRLEATLDLAFVRELVEPLYVHGGRPSLVCAGVLWGAGAVELRPNGVLGSFGYCSAPPLLA